MVSWVHTSRMNLQDKRSFKLCIFKCLCYIEKNHLIGFSDLVDLWVIKIKKPMILCACSTSRSREQSTKYADHTARTCLFYSHNNKIVWLSNMEDTFLEKFTSCAKVCGICFLNCALRVLIGWADKLRWHRMFSLQFWLILSSAS